MRGTSARSENPSAGVGKIETMYLSYSVKNEFKQDLRDISNTIIAGALVACVFEKNKNNAIIVGVIGLVLGGIAKYESFS